MQALFEIGVTNALVAALLGILVFGMTRFWRNPHVVHLLWILVLVKLVAPPLVCLPWSIDLAASDRNEGLAAGERSLFTGDLDAYSISVENENIEVPVIEDSGAWQPEEFPPQPSDLVYDAEMAAQFPAFLPAATSEIRRPSVEKHFMSLWPLLKPTAMWLWLTGSVGLLSVIAVRVIRFHRCLQNTLPASRRLEERTRSLATRIGLRDCPQVRIVQAAVAPMVWAVGKRPMIVLPIALLHRLGGDELDTVLMHELAHIRRRDHWVRWFELVVTLLYWWNPVVWWARRELRGAEEACCDAWVQREFPGKTKSYASALLATAEFVRRDKTVVPVMCNAFGTGKTLKRRVEMIINQTSCARLSWPLRLGILLVAALALPLSAQTVDDANDTPETVIEKSEDVEADDLEADSDYLLVAPAAAREKDDLEGELDELLVKQDNLRESLANKKDNLQERVKKLEKQIESLLREVRKLQGAKRGEAPSSDQIESLLRGLKMLKDIERGGATDRNTRTSRGDAVLGLRVRTPKYPMTNRVVESIATSNPSPSVSPRVVLALVGALKDEDKQVQIEAMKSLRNVGADSKEAILGVINVLKQGNQQLRITAAEVLGTIGKNSDDAITALVEALEDDSPEVRKAAIVSLGRIASPSRPGAVPDPFQR